MKSAKFEDDFIKSLIKQNEGEKLDFKQKITSKEKISKTLAGLANTEGGYILIGISDKKRIIGIDPDEERYMIESANEEFCVPPVSLTINEIKIYDEKYPEQYEDERSLLLVKIEKASGPKVCCKTKDGRLISYVRINDRTLAV
jgi:predicted HTH transcriptional regulator